MSRPDGLYDNKLIKRRELYISGEVVISWPFESINKGGNGLTVQINEVLLSSLLKTNKDRRIRALASTLTLPWGVYPTYDEAE